MGQEKKMLLNFLFAVLFAFTTGMLGSRQVREQKTLGRVLFALWAVAAIYWLYIFALAIVSQWLP